jgi:mono/diheme cytochrome c family protein
MLDLQSTVLAASTVKSVGSVIAVLVLIGFVWYVAVNIRSGRHEVGSEIELAPNRKPYFDDEGLEGPRLTRVLSTGLVLLGVVAIGLPLYWLNEPGRMDGAIETFDQTFVNRGAALFAPTAEGGYDCAGCHGQDGVGGVTNFTLTDADNEFVATVNWMAPALNTVLLRYSEQEVRDILVYGRPGTPMPAWGAEGGGPLTTQQIDELIAYLQSIQISSDEAKEEVETILREALELGEDEEINYRDPAVGEALFTLGLDTGAAGGAYSCARCHTKGASLVDGSEQPAGADLSDFKGFAHGSGAFGFSLTSGIIPRQFLSLEELVEFITKGSEYGMLYGQRGQGTGRMPGFGDNPNTEDAEDDGMFTDGMLRAVARYEANLEGEDAVEPGQETGDVTTTTTAIPGAGATSSTTSTTQQES